MRFEANEVLHGPFTTINRGRLNDVDALAPVFQFTLGFFKIYFVKQLVVLWILYVVVPAAVDVIY